MGCVTRSGTSRAAAETQQPQQTQGEAKLAGPVVQAQPIQQQQNHAEQPTATQLAASEQAAKQQAD